MLLASVPLALFLTSDGWKRLLLIGSVAVPIMLLIAGAAWLLAVVQRFG